MHEIWSIEDDGVEEEVMRSSLVLFMQSATFKF
jgi:hypothetical protein